MTDETHVEEVVATETPVIAPESTEEVIVPEVVPEATEEVADETTPA